MPAKKETKEAQMEATEATYKSAHDNEDFIIVRKDDFQQGVSTLLYYAWKHRNSESHLYALYNYIQSLQCLTLRNKARPGRVIAPWPQPLFGTLEPPQGESNYPRRTDTLPSNYLPDHARIMIFGSKEQGPSYSLQARISIAFDSSEVKVLNIKTPWHRSGAKREAQKTAESHIAQVYDSSLAGLAHNPFWASLYAFLLVGPYFSLFAWKTRPDAAYLEPLPAIPNVPQPRGWKKKELETLIAKRKAVIEQRIERIKNTPLPDVIYYSEPVFNFTHKGDQKWYDNVTLSPKYLHALSLPTSALEELECQPSWLRAGNPRSARGVNVQQDLGRQFLRTIVIDDPIQDELTTMELVSDRPDPTLAGPKPPDSSDSQQSRFSEAEPQVLNPNAGPHQMRTRASNQEVEDIASDILG